MSRLPVTICLLFATLLLMGADGCSSDPNVEGAKLDLRNKDYARALENIDTALGTNPANAEALELKGRVLSEMAFATTDADENASLIGRMIEAYDAALGADPTLEPTVSRAKAIAYVNEFQLGLQAFNRGRDNDAEYMTAAKFFGTASVIAPDSAGAYVNQAYALMNSGDTATAIEPFENALEKGDTEVDTYRFLSNLYQANGRVEDAVGVLETASELYPNNVDVQAEMLNAFQLAGQSDRAMAMYESAVANDPTNKLYRYNYGSLLVQMEQYDDAIEQLRIATELDPSYANAQYNLGAAYINKAVNVNDRINELDDALRAERGSLSSADITSREAEIDRLADERRALFSSATGPLASARELMVAEGDDATAVCMALYQSYVQTNDLEKAQEVSACAGYED